MTDDDGPSGRQSLPHLAARLAFVSTILARTGARRAADDLRALRAQILALVETSPENPKAGTPADDRSRDTK